MCNIYRQDVWGMCHIYRNKNAYRVLVGKPEGKKPQGRHWQR